MSLWVNRLKQLSSVAVALFFFSCEDEKNLLGFKNPNTKFESYYVEIPLGDASSVVLRDSVRTLNYVTSNERNRLLVGRYTDPDLGEIRATGYSEIFSSSATKVAADAKPTIDSVSIELALDDFFSYGKKTATVLKLKVSELEQNLLNENSISYFNDRQTAIAGLLGEKSFTVDPVKLADLSDDNPIPSVMYSIRLNQEFGQRLYNTALAFRQAQNEVDSSYYLYSEFKKLFKGLALELDYESDAANDLMIAISTLSSSRVVVHYQTDTRDSLRMTFNLSGLSYSQITTERAGTQLDGITKGVPFYPADKRRYIQAGTGIHTRLDFSKFLEFANEDSVKNILINEAELVIGGVTPSDLEVPPSLAMRVLRTNTNWFRKLKNKTDTTELNLSAGYASVDFKIPGRQSDAVIDSDDVFYVVNDQKTGYVMRYYPTRKQYSGFITMLAQKMYQNKDRPTVLKDFLLYPADPTFVGMWAKSVHRVSFPAEQIVLRIKYTKPTVKD